MMKVFAFIACCAVVMLQGCTSIYRGVLIEPPILPHVDYACPVFTRESNRVPVGVDVKDCPAACTVICKGVLGGSEKIQQINFRQILGREFQKMVAVNFAESSGSVAPVMTFRIRASEINLVRNHYFWWWNPDELVAQFKFVVILKDPEDSSRDHFFEEEYSFKEASQLDRVDCRTVPKCLYDIATKFADQVVRDIANDASIVNRIQKKVGSRGRVIQEKGADFTSFSISPNPVPGTDNVYAGTCVVACNDWDSNKSSKWAEREIKAHCAQKLGWPEEKVRVLYDRMDVGDKTCSYEFRCLIRQEFVMHFDPQTRQGSVVADPDLLHLTQASASKVIEERIYAEMMKRGGATRAMGDTTGAKVRLGAIETDKASGLYKVEFKLVY